jgi:hypothetical protein
MMQDSYEQVYYFWYAEVRNKHDSSKWSDHYGVTEAKRNSHGALLVQDVLDHIEKDCRKRSCCPDGNYTLKTFNRV